MTALERTNAALEAVAKSAHLNIFLDLDAEGARAAAQASDDRATPMGTMDGKLLGIKANFAVKGLPWSAAIIGLKDRIASQDAGAVARLRDAGAIILGTVNMHEGALGAVTDSPGFGRCANPLIHDHTPGGSSGGSAAAIAAGFVDCALGSDTMGSSRIPAAYCGVAGIKPTDALIGRSGLALLSPSLDVIGPLAANVRDLWPVLQTLAGPNSADALLQPLPRNWPLAPEWRTDLQAVRIGLPAQIADVDCEPEILLGLQRAATALTALGAQVIPVDIVGWAPGHARRGGLLLTEAEGAVENAALLAGPQGTITPAFRAALEYGRDASSARLVDALARIANTGAACARAMVGIDALLMPTAPQRAFAHGSEVPANQADFSALANFSKRPAVSLPVPLSGEILPASVQLVGHPGDDPRLLSIADVLDRALNSAAADC
ncbi:MAG: aspartyl-tRNA(Asn)/glutamyl-tRNA(Gln) amidotransferase subunit A [Gammaproteobacteria bacterium]|jgi:aspartyl-tRNA(Asn)/glutamyl-tRNA(Gln) amidotransferase subunit A